MGLFLDLENIVCIVSELKQQGKKIVTTNGCFDIMHLGHMMYLQEAKKLGDILVIGVNTDHSVSSIKGPLRPINSEVARSQLLAGLYCVDFVFLFNENTPVEFLKKIKPDIHVKGNDYSVETLPEAKEVLALGSELKFVQLVEGFSTTEMISKIIKAYS